MTAQGEDCVPLAAWAGLDLGDDIAGEALRAAPRQARNVSNAGSFFFESRHDQGLEG